MNLKKDFPIFENQKIIYLDSAATTQLPKQVVNAIKNFHEKNNANIHRGIYKLSEKATEDYETARRTIAKFIKVEIIFKRNVLYVHFSFIRCYLPRDDI